MNPTAFKKSLPLQTKGNSLALYCANSIRVEQVSVGQERPDSKRLYRGRSHPRESTKSEDTPMRV